MFGDHLLQKALHFCILHYFLSLPRVLQYISMCVVALYYCWQFATAEPRIVWSYFQKEFGRVERIFMEMLRTHTNEPGALTSVHVIVIVMIIKMIINLIIIIVLVINLMMMMTVMMMSTGVKSYLFLGYSWTESIDWWQRGINWDSQRKSVGELQKMPFAEVKTNKHTNKQANKQIIMSRLRLGPALKPWGQSWRADMLTFMPSVTDESLWRLQ